METLWSQNYQLYYFLSLDSVSPSVKLKNSIFSNFVRMWPENLYKALMDISIHNTLALKNYFWFLV